MYKNKSYTMKILLNGATAGTNFGDFLFAKMFQQKVSELVGENNVYWYSSRYALSDFYAHHLKYSRKYRLGDINGLIYISGGYFHGDDHTLKDYIIRYLRYFHIGIRCILRKIPMAICAVEVGSTNSRFIYLVEKLILKKSKIIIVRNDESYNYAISMGAKNVICTADSVFALSKSMFDDYSVPSLIKSDRSKLLFLHVNRSVDENKQILEKIVPIVNEFCLNHPEYNVVVGMDQYTSNQKDIFDYLANFITAPTIFNEYNDPFQLCKTIDMCDLIVTHKLHVGIVGAHLGKSIISFSGHTSKIERLYKQLNIPSRTVPLKNLSKELGVQMLERYHDEPVEVPKEVRDAAKSNFSHLECFIKQLSGNY